MIASSTHCPWHLVASYSVVLILPIFASHSISYLDNRCDPHSRHALHTLSIRCTSNQHVPTCRPHVAPHVTLTRGVHRSRRATHPRLSGVVRCPVPQPAHRNRDVGHMTIPNIADPKTAGGRPCGPCCGARPLLVRTFPPAYRRRIGGDHATIPLSPCANVAHTGVATPLLPHVSLLKYPRLSTPIFDNSHLNSRRSLTSV